MGILNLSSETYDNTVCNGRVLVDFWASWCVPCKMVAPIIEELASLYSGQVVFGKVDVDSESELAIRYDIVSIPTVILFENGNEVKRFIGVQPKEAYMAELGAI